MLFLYENGDCIEKCFGFKPTGLKRNNKRPIGLYIEADEIFASSVRRDKLRHYLHILESSLDFKSKEFYIKI